MLFTVSRRATPFRFLEDGPHGQMSRVFEPPRSGVGAPRSHEKNLSLAVLVSTCWLALSACTTSGTTRTKPVVRREIAVPAPDTTPNCSDVMAARVCWNERGAPVSVVRAPLPSAAPSVLGFRCSGHGTQRRCTERALDAEGFQCSGDRCVQRHPRLPDDGEWECADSAGTMVCRGGERPAGVAPGGRPEGFFCGALRSARQETQARICVDLSPDLPPGPTGYSCHFEGTSRICVVNRDTHRLGDPCDRARPCVDGARCVGGQCAPILPQPSCWADADCDHKACRFGTCTEDAS